MACRARYVKGNLVKKEPEKRMDAKANRKQKVLVVHNIHFEPVDLNEISIEKFVQALTAFVRFNKCQDIIFKKSNNGNYLEAIIKNFSQLIA